MPSERTESKGHLDLLILAVLANEPAHGYRIIACLRERSSGTFDLPEGTVYPALHRLEADGLVTSEWQVAGGRRRRSYHLSARGRDLLGSQLEQWERFSRGVNAVLSWSG
jgi:DNA-binding PadR family transcriptional regulator